MKKEICITVDLIEDGETIKSKVIIKQNVQAITSIKDLGFNHQQQINILKGSQEELLKAQSAFLKENISQCPKCGAKLKFVGYTFSDFHSVFTDHKVGVRRQKCCNKSCGLTSVPSISSLFKTSLHPDFAKLQTETACSHTYRETQKILNGQSYHPRKANNLASLHQVVEIIGEYISNHQAKEIPKNISPTKELICQVDGGHLASLEEDKRSFEALAAVIYSPENIVYPDKKEKDVDPSKILKGVITSKHCAASALNDELVTIKRQTLLAAFKQGMTKDTIIIAICDGASNCWNVAQSLQKKCKKIIKILDWFHIAKRFQNISLPKYLQKELDKAKWCIWHGKSEEGIDRFDEIISKTRSQKMKDRLQKLEGYLCNNQDCLVDYAKRYDEGKVITSSLAESNIENLINRRCKGRQHMKWLRKGVHPLLQVRASFASNDWKIFGDQYVLNAITQAAA